MKNLKYLVIAVSVFMLLGFSTNAQASKLYGLAQDFESRGLDDTRMEVEKPQTIFYSIDPDTGIPTMIGETGFDTCTALDFEPITNRAFAVCNRIVDRNGEVFEQRLEDQEDVGQVLVELDMTTGQGTEIGPLGIFLKNTGVTDISFRPDGILFGIVSSGDVSPGSDEEKKIAKLDEVELITIETTTGQASLVGETGTGRSLDAIGFSPEGHLYHATDNALDPGTFNMLDHGTGLGTKINDLVYPAGFDQKDVINVVTSLDYDTSKNQLSGILISFLGESETDPKVESKVEFAEGSFLLTLDADSGAIELIGMTAPFGNQFTSIAFLNRKLVSEVPTLSEYGLIATAVFFLGASVLFLRRRQFKTES